MFASVCRPLTVGVMVLAGLGAWATSPVGAAALDMKVGGWTNPPVGYIEFCKNFPDQCKAHGQESVEPLTERHWRDLEEINTFANHVVAPATDMEIYHREEVWTLPESRGDCEDYVLLKRKWLVERGWSTGSLLITVVFDEVGDGHAVLLARTTGGDFVLDNKTDLIVRWYDTAYRFVKRQSSSDPNRWVSVGDPRWNTRATASK